MNQPALGADSHSSDLPSISLVSQKSKSIKTLWRSKAEAPDQVSNFISKQTVNTDDHPSMFVCGLFFWALSQLIYGSAQAPLVKADVGAGRAGGEGKLATHRSALPSAGAMDIWVNTAPSSLQNSTNEEILHPP